MDSHGPPNTGEYEGMMGGFSSGTVYGHTYEYGDFANVQVFDSSPQGFRWVLCTFVETTDDGDHIFRIVCEEDPGDYRGDDILSDHYAAVGDIKFAYGKDDPTPEIGAFI